MEFLYNNKIRTIFFQVLTLLIIFYFSYQAIDSLFDNIASRGIRTGFAFLEIATDFDISEHFIDYTPASSNLAALYVGIINTLVASVVGIIFASLIGLIIGISRISSNWLLRRLAEGYIELFRNIPILLQILFWYNIILNILPSARQSLNFLDLFFLNIRGLYIPKLALENGFIWVLLAFIIGIVLRYFVKQYFKQQHDQFGSQTNTIPYTVALLLLLPISVFYITGSPISFEIPALKGFNFQGGMSLSPEFVALVFALSIYTATYIAEAIRSGIESVDKGQKEAAKALGFSTKQSLKLIILPQAMRVAIPPIINQYLNLTKNSSLAAAIGYSDIVAVFSGTVLNNVGQAVEIIMITMSVYLVISLIISMILNLINHKNKIIGRGH